MPSRSGSGQFKGLANQPDVTVLAVRNVLRNVEVLDLRVLKRLVNGIDRAAGHTGVVQFLDPSVGRLFFREFVDLGI